jgi:quercetin dioxygenase-like cupin family protein
MIGPQAGDGSDQEAAVESWNVRSMELEPHHPVVLRSGEEARSIALNLPAGEELQEHRTHEAAYLVVVEGDVELSQDGQVTAAPPGFVAYFEANETRHVRAGSDARILLILGPWPGEGHPSRRS